VFRGSPAELIGLAAGKVVEVDVGAANETEVLDKLEIVQQYSAGGVMRLRGVLRDGGIAAARPVEAVTLEEAYLAFMVGRGRHVEELEMSDSAAAAPESAN
jgi:hypothetical protein